MMYGDLKLSFIRKCQEEYLQRVKYAMAVLIRRKKIGVTEHLVGSLASRVKESGPSVTGELLFDESGRFIDMGVGRGYKIGGLRATRALLTNKKAVPGRKPKKIYSPVIYGNLTQLQNQLLHGFTEEAIAILKQELYNGTTNN